MAEGKRLTSTGRSRDEPDPGARARAAIFTEAELAFLRGERRLARVATVGPDGTPHVTPVGMWSYNAELGTIDISGHEFASTKKFRDVGRTERAAIVVDEVLPPFRPRGIEVRGTAQAVHAPRPLIRLRPRRIISWGIDSTEFGRRNARDVRWIIS